MGDNNVAAWWERRQMRRRAGRRARDQYRAQRKAWLREKRKVFAGLAAVFLLVVAGFHLLTVALPGDYGWLSGFVAGALLMALIAFHHQPPGVIEQWQQGAWGEEFTASEIVGLTRKGWVVLNDLRNDDYNFDHVVIGPAGIFCLNSKKTNYVLEVPENGERLRFVNKYAPTIAAWDQRTLPRARREAFDLHALIQKRTGYRAWVQPVVVWWGDFPQRRAEVNGVQLVHGRQLVEFLEQQPARRPLDIDAVVAAIRPGRRRASWQFALRPRKARAASA